MKQARLRDFFPVKTPRREKMRTLKYRHVCRRYRRLFHSFIYVVTCLSGTSCDSASEGARRIMFPSPGWSWHNRMICFTILQLEPVAADQLRESHVTGRISSRVPTPPLHLAVSSRHTSRGINSCSAKRLSPYRQCLHGHSIKFKTNILFHVLFINSRAKLYRQLSSLEPACHIRENCSDAVSQKLSFSSTEEWN